jgi:hypothetical protein
LTSSPTRHPGPPWLQIDVHDAYQIGFGRYIYARKEDEITFQMEVVLGPNKIGLDQNYQNNFNIQSPSGPGAIHIETDAQVA